MSSNDDSSTKMSEAWRDIFSIIGGILGFAGFIFLLYVGYVLLVYFSDMRNFSFNDVNPVNMFKSTPTMSETCNSKNDMQWKSYSIKNANNPGVYSFDSCVNKKTGNVIFDKQYGWVQTNYSDEFSKACVAAGGRNFVNTFEKPDRISNIRYDHLYGCVKNDKIVKFLVNSDSSKTVKQ